MITSSQLITIVLTSSVVSAIVSGFLNLLVLHLNKQHERYEKLYGPLIYKLLAMDVIARNNKELTDEIMRELGSIEMKNKSLIEEINPLVKQWIQYKDEIKELFETNAGSIKKCDLPLVENFLDGLVKKEISKDGQNGRTNSERIDKILKAIAELQNKFLKSWWQKISS